jgi:hypothetical protein
MTPQKQSTWYSIDYFPFKHERNALVICNFNILFLHVGAESMRSRENENMTSRSGPEVMCSFRAVQMQ